MASRVAGPEIERLIQLLARLPGLGPRSARRAALHLISKREELLGPLADAMRVANERILVCSACGNIDTSDAGIIIDYENFLIFWDQPDDALYLKAADLNGDGNIDTADAGIIVDFENFLLTINQTTGLAG